MKRKHHPVTSWHIVTRFETPQLHTKTVQGKAAIIPSLSKLSAIVTSGDGNARSMKFRATAEMLEYVLTGQVAKSSLPRRPYNLSLTEAQPERYFLLGVGPHKFVTDGVTEDAEAVVTILSFQLDDSGVMRKANGEPYVVVQVDTASPHGILNVVSTPSGNFSDSMPELLQMLYLVDEFQPGSTIEHSGWFVSDANAGTGLLRLTPPEPGDR